MKFQTKDPDIATIFRRIKRKKIDLQPDFQRGEVWSVGKKQRLIDTILRQWHVPPVHLVAKGEGKFDVLDGQQRLTAIRDFLLNLFTVDGYIDPIVPEFAELHGQIFSDLPDAVQEQFESFAIRVFELHDYSPDEPHELFFRLNQPMTLTEAEKRNAFMGPARDQVKELVQWAVEQGMTATRIGFSNARMAYDDLLARFLLTLEQRSLSEKVTSMRITGRYRAKDPFEDDIIDRAMRAIEFVLLLPMFEDNVRRAKPNKATIHTWLCMAAKLDKEGSLDRLSDELAEVIDFIESWRSDRVTVQDDIEEVPLAIFHDRATARVADVSSVVLRDFTAWMMFVRMVSDAQFPRFLNGAKAAWGSDLRRRGLESAIPQVAARNRWGDLGWL